MNKDAILATLIGFGIGLLITGLLLVGPSLLAYIPPISIPAFSFLQQNRTPVATPTPQPHVAEFSIESPLAETIENTEDLLVSGKAPTGTVVVIAGPNDEVAVTSNANNTYAGKITLTEGKNDIIVTMQSTESSKSQTVSVYYTQESL